MQFVTAVLRLCGMVPYTILSEILQKHLKFNEFVFNHLILAAE